MRDLRYGLMFNSSMMEDNSCLALLLLQGDNTRCADDDWLDMDMLFVDYIDDNLDRAPDRL